MACDQEPKQYCLQSVQDELALADQLFTCLNLREWVTQVPFTPGQWVMAASSGFTHICAGWTQSLRFKLVKRWLASTNLS